MSMVRTPALGAAMILAVTTAQSTEPSELERNKALVTAFYEKALNEKDIESAIAMMGPTYTQHNARILDDKEGFRQYFTGFKQRYPLEVTNTLKELIEAPSLEPRMGLDAAEFVDNLLGSLKNYAAPTFVREDYIASYTGDRPPESGRLVRRHPDELALLKDFRPDIDTPVPVISGRLDPFVPLSNGQFLVDRLLNALHEIVDIGHLEREDAAETYATLVLDWVEEHGNQ